RGTCCRCPRRMSRSRYGSAAPRIVPMLSAKTPPATLITRELPPPRTKTRVARSGLSITSERARSQRRRETTRRWLRLVSLTGGCSGPAGAGRCNLVVRPLHAERPPVTMQDACAMNGRIIIEFANLFCAGILAGAEVVIHYGLPAPIEVLDDQSQIRF